MATVKKEKGVTINSRGTYEVRLGGTYYGSRKTLKEANDLSITCQGTTGNGKPKKKQSVVTGRKNKAVAVKKTVTVAATKIPCPCENISPPLPSSRQIQRLEEQPKKKSFWQFLKSMFK